MCRAVKRPPVVGRPTSLHAWELRVADLVGLNGGGRHRLVRLAGGAVRRLHPQRALGVVVRRERHLVALLHRVEEELAALQICTHAHAYLHSVLDKRLRPTTMLYVVGPISAGCFTSGCRYDAMQWIHRKYIPCWDSANYRVPLAAPTWHRRENWTTMLRVRGGTIHRCIDISRYFSRDTYRNFFFFFFFHFFFHNDFHLGRKET